MARKKKVLVTGSGGFIFGNFIRQVFYAKKPYTISSLDRVRESHIIHNIYVNADHSFYIADVRDPHTLHVIFQKEHPDVVVHGAAESCVDKSINTTLPFTTSNVVGTQNIIDECLGVGARLVYMSTDEVYGALPNDKAEPWGEDAPLNPRNTYSATKAAGELLVRAAAETHNLRYSIVRACNNYGPWQTNEKFVPRIIHRVLNNEEIPVYGKGDQIRDWIHVFDTCSALFHVIDKGLDGEVYNITAKQEFMNLEVAQIVCNTLGKGHELLKHVEDRPGHDFRYAMTNDKIKELGWEPKFKFREGIQQTCQWYVTNQYVLNM
jgi:dTDP-glucose 4,6-dehydratase